MVSPRWKKLLRDLQTAQGRMAMMVIAIAVSVFAVATILSAYAILTREMSRNYLGTNPASAYLELDRVDDAAVQLAREQPGIADAEATSWVMTRAEVKSNEWIPLLLFVVKDFSAIRIGTFVPASGAWPPPERTILLERSVLPLVNIRVGDSLYVQTSNGSKLPVTVSGFAHDSGLAPAWQGQMAYAYATPSTLAWLGEGDTLHILKVVVKDQPRDIAAIDSTAGNLAELLRGRGYAVGEIRIPPPGQHPHQSQMNSILVLLLAFSLMALILSAILTSTMIGGLLAQQIRQIGIMKAIGGRSSQITGLYLILVVFLGLAAVALGSLPGIAAGRGFAGTVAELLNFTMYSQDVPNWVYLLLLLLGILVPLLAALNPILRTARTTVREIISDYGTSRGAFGSRGLDGWLGRIRGVDRTLILALRNTFRRRGRLLLILGLLATAGGMFMTGVNVNAGWDRYITAATSNHSYDLEIRFNGPQPEESVLSVIADVPGVQKVESWNLAPVALYRPDGLDIVRTYPDGGHGSLEIRSAAPESELLQVALTSGRWLKVDDIDAVVLNQTASLFFPNAKVGDTLRATVNGRAATFRLVGLTRQIMTPAAAYVTPSTFAESVGLPPRSTNAVRVVMDEHDATTIGAVTGKIEAALSARGIGVQALISETMLEGAVRGHIYIFIYALILMSVVMAVVGALGLTSSMGTSVVERTREFGIMRTVGARSITILRNVISEGVFVGLMSWGIAIVLSIPLSLGVGNLVGTMAFASPLPLILSPMALVIWLLVIVLGSIAATAYPAWQASRLTIRETLSYF